MTDLEKTISKLSRQINRLEAALSMAASKLSKEPGLTPDETARNKRFLNGVRANIAELVRKREGLRGRAS